MTPASQELTRAAEPWFAPLLLCLACRTKGLSLNGDVARCRSCGSSWPIVRGIPAFAGQAPLVVPDDPRGEVEAAVRQFYESNPFPTYDDFDSVASLMHKARRGMYAKLLDDQLPPSIRVLECGCGTGQMSVFLSMANRFCLGVDMCMASLGCGKRFRDQHGLGSVDFVQGNLFDLPVAEESFDVVICKGVLHHTADPRAAFMEVAKRVRKGGYLIVGLYNRYGRVPSWCRKQLYRALPRWRRGDYVMRKLIESPEKRRIWWEDQYNNPHESWHSVGEVLGWFREAGIEYVNAFPPITLASRGQSGALFEPTSPGTGLERLLVQLSWMFTIGREGALFDMIGRRAPT